MVLADSAAHLTALHTEAALIAGKEPQQLSLCSPLIDLAPLKTADWFTFPFQRTYEFKWDIRLLGPWLVATLASTLETMGDLTATARLSGKRTDGQYFAERMRGGLNGDAVGSFISALIGTLPNTTFSQNNGLISLTGAHDYRAGVAAGVALMLIGVCSKFAGCLRSVPLPVMGGVFSVLFALVALSGVRMICESDLQPIDSSVQVAERSHEEQHGLQRTGTRVERVPRRTLDSTRNQFIVAASLGVGIGTSMNAFQRNNTTLGFASWLSDSLAASTLLSNGVSLTSLVAVGLSFLLPLPVSDTDGGEGDRGYAPLNRESTAMPMDPSHGSDSGIGSDRRNDIQGEESQGGGTGNPDDETEVQQLRAECLRLQQLLAKQEDEGVRKKLARP
jgi:xanthine/uracil permease